MSGNKQMVYLAGPPVLMIVEHLHLHQHGVVELSESSPSDCWLLAVRTTTASTLIATCV